VNKPYYQLTKPELKVMLQTFQTVALANAATLGLTPANLSEISGRNTAFGSSVSDQQNAQAAAKGAVADCTAERDTSITMIGKYNAIFQANPAVSDELIAQLGLPVRNGSGDHLPLYAPTELSAIGCSNGLNSLKWKRNGNLPGVSYVIEAAYDGTEDWEIVDVVSTIKFDHTGQTPGRPVAYRVFARRRNERSAPSGVASIYGNGSGQSQSLKVA